MTDDVIMTDEGTTGAAPPVQDPAILAEQFKAEGNAKYTAKEYHAAIAAYSEAIRLAPNHAAYFANRAAAELMLGRYKEVIADCKAALQLDPKFVRALLREAKAQFCLGEPKLAADLYAQVLQIEPKNPDALQSKQQIGVLEWKMDRAQSNIKTEKYGDALSCIDGALELAPASVNLKLLRAQCLLELQRTEEALSVATMVLRDDTSNPLALLLRARALHRTGSGDVAIKHLQEALRFDPDYHEARKELRKIREMVLMVYILVHSHEYRTHRKQQATKHSKQVAGRKQLMHIRDVLAWILPIRLSLLKCIAIVQQHWIN